jgi:transcriptional regulator with PAS, ATPase and Fis domain
MQSALNRLVDSKPKLGLVPNCGSAPSVGLVVTSESGHVIASLGVGADSGVAAIVSDRQWLAAAPPHGLVPILLRDQKFMASVTRVNAGHVVLLSEGATGSVLRFEDLARRESALEQRHASFKMESSEDKRGEQVLDAIIGKSLAIQSVRQQIRKVAPLDVPVLIQGESGTGKELVAAALHMLSPRHSAGRLITVNAAALPAALVESELFGYEAGSFTGADRKGRPGKFELADKGTIFLDEIGDMPLEVQSKVLRVLQDRVVERVGGDKAKRVDFRLCSATHCDLELLVEQNKFRLDLFYRISPICIVLPTLEERVEDIPLLLHHFLRLLSEKFGRQAPEVDQNVPEFLMARSWPGNIRQLQHEVERAFVFSENGRLSVADFQQDSVWKSPRTAAVTSSALNATPGHGPMQAAIAQLERDLIADAMTRFKGNKKKVSEHLGISRSYLYKKLGE